MRRLILAGIMFLALACIVEATPAHQITHGGSEDTLLSGSAGFVECPDSVKESCVLFDGSGDMRTSWALAEGIRSRMTGNTASRSLSTTATASYTLSFDMAGNPECRPDEKALMVYWGNLPGFGPYSYGAAVPGGWTTITLDDLPGTEGITTLTFEDISDPSSACGIALDNISVTSTTLIPVPEFPPMTLPLGLIVGIGAIILRQTNRI